MKNLLWASGLALTISLAPAFAQGVIDNILSGDEYEGVEVTETSSSFWGIKVTVVLADGTTVTRLYRKNGSLKSEVSVSSSGEREATTFTRSGDAVDTAAIAKKVTEASQDSGDSGGSGDECAPDQC